MNIILNIQTSHLHTSNVTLYILIIYYSEIDDDPDDGQDNGFNNI